MGLRGFRYNKYINIPRRWQEYIYAYSKMYNDSAEHAAVIDKVCLLVAPDYFTELKRIVVCGESAVKVGLDYCISDKTLQRKVRRYYELMYGLLK